MWRTFSFSTPFCYFFSTPPPPGRSELTEISLPQARAGITRTPDADVCDGATFGSVDLREDSNLSLVVRFLSGLSQICLLLSIPCSSPTPPEPFYLSGHCRYIRILLFVCFFFFFLLFLPDALERIRGKSGFKANAIDCPGFSLFFLPAAQAIRQG